MQEQETEPLHECTKDGTIDFYGKPAARNRTGGWRGGMLILGTLNSFYFLECSKKLVKWEDPNPILLL